MAANPKKEEPKEKPEEKEGKGSVVTVYDKKGVVLRIMDKKTYGKDFRAKAKMLAGKEKGRVVKEGRPKGSPGEEKEEPEEGTEE